MGAGSDLLQQGIEVLRLGLALLLNPQPVHIHMQHFKTHVLCGFLGTHQRLPAPGGHRLVRFDPAEAGILVPEITKAGH